MKGLLVTVLSFWMVVANPHLQARGQTQTKAQLQYAKLRAQLTIHYGKVELQAALKVQKKLRRLSVKVYGPKHPRTIQEIGGCATLAAVTGAFAEAKAFMDAHIALNKEVHGEGSRQHVGALSRLVHHHAQLNQHDKARELEQRILKIHERGKTGTDLLYPSSLQSFGATAMNRHEYSLARQRYMKAYELIEKEHGEESPQLGSVLSMLGTLHWQMGERARAAQWWQRAVEVSEKAYGKDHTLVAASLLMWAGYHRRAGEVAKADPIEVRALEIYQRALEKARTKGAVGLVGVQINRTGMINIRLSRGDLKEAEALLEASIRDREQQAKAAKTPYHRSGVANLNNYFNLVDLYRQQKRYRKALKVLDRIARIQKDSWGKNFSNNSMWSRARILFEMGDNKAAHQVFKALLKGRKEIYGPRHPYVGYALEGLARSAMGSDRGSDALKHLKTSLEMTEEEIKLHLAIGNESDNRAFIRSKAYQVDLAVSLHHGYLRDQEEAARVALETVLRRKARALDAAVDTRSAIRSKLSPESLELFDSLTALRSSLARLVVSGPKTVAPGTFPARIGAIEEKIRNTEMKLRRSSQAFEAQESVVTLAAIQKKLSKDAALIEFVAIRPFDAKNMNQRGPARYVAYVLSKGSKGPHVIDLGEAVALEAHIASFRQSLSSAESLDVEEEAQRVYALLFKELGPLVKDKSHLIISPDGALNLVPFGALMDSTGRYLIRAKTITYVTSGRDLLRQSAPSKRGGKTTIFADPTFEKLDTKSKNTHRGTRSVDFASMRWSPLPATAKEASALEKVIKDAVVYRGAEANEEQIKGLRGPNVLHVATHGFFLAPSKKSASAPEDGWGQTRVVSAGDENPLLRSGLILAGPGDRPNAEDGVLTALEASGLDLSGTKLVVLSACDTGVGDISQGEGVHGLRRALVVAGAQSLLMSLWKVDDDATRHLMAGYYRKVAQGTPPSQALRQMKLSMSRSERYSHPMYWAAFIPVGVSGPISLD